MTCAISYSWLKRTTEVQKPIRGTTNRYPVSGRQYAHYKYFLTEQMDGETVFVVHYGKKWVKRDVSQEEYTEMVKTNNPLRSGVAHGVNSYYIYEPHPNPILIVRPDETMEFCAEHYYQGTRQILNEWFPYRITLCTESRRGGTIIRNHRNSSWDDPEVAHPLFKGLRVDIDSLQLHPASNYDYYKARVDRKGSKQVIAESMEMIKSAEPFMAALELEGLMLLSKDIFHDFKQMPKSNDYRDAEADKTIWLEKYRDDPVNFCLANFWIGQSGWFISPPADAMMNWVLNRSRHSIIDQVKRRLRKSTYSHSNGALYYDQIPTGKLPKSGDWGFMIKVNGEKVNQYS